MTSSRNSVVLISLVLASCGGGGGGSPTPTLTSIMLSPVSVSLAPGGRQQLTVTGVYGGSSTQILTPSGEAFASTDTGVATVSTGGFVTVASGAAVGSTATITATDMMSGIKTLSAGSSVITVSSSASLGPPAAGSVSAAGATAQNNTVCAALEPFYWEIGDQTGSLASGSVGTNASGAPVLAKTRGSIASASKWIYGMYVVQVRAGVAGLTAQDINFLHFTSGYTHMGSDASTSTCPAPASGADSVLQCLTRSGPNGAFDAQNPATEGVFDYDSGHEENHAGQFQPEIAALDASTLGPAIVSGLGLANSSIQLLYTEPLLAGGIYAAADDYTPILRGILSGQILMHDALGTNSVCAWSVGSTCNATSSPILTEHWHYSIAHWVEDDPNQNNDGAFSSPGAFGFYPWIDAKKSYYGVLSRFAPTGSGVQNGVASAKCGALVRHAWDTGMEQNGTIPNP